MYFRHEVPLNETTHRSVLYTNVGSTSSTPIDLPFARFALSTSLDTVNAVTIEVVDRLEAIDLDGEPEFLVGTNGSDLIDDAADVFAFAFKVTCSRDAALVRRLVPATVGPAPSRTGADILRRTFDPNVFLKQEELTVACEFADGLLALDRRHYEATMRAIRTVVDASLLVADEPGLAYTLYVAALESLAQIAIAAETLHDWDRYPKDRRKIFETAFADAALDGDQIETMRSAVMAVDQLSLRRRFIDFTLAHTEPGFFRDEAIDAAHPARAEDLPYALSVAYELRSKNVHALEALVPELWAISHRSDTLWWKGRKVLGLEGLDRLARHVIMAFVARSPVGIDPEFRYREHLPGIVRVPIAPQYWIWDADRFSGKRAASVLNGFCEILVDPSRPTLPDMSSVLERIEKMVGSTAAGDARESMVALYCMWHSLLLPEHHRPAAAEAMAIYQSDLDHPCSAGFVARFLTGHPIEWTTAELVALTRERQADLRRPHPRQPLPPQLDAALLVLAAERTWASGDINGALGLLSDAVETLPGNPVAISLEEEAINGTPPNLESFWDGLRASDREPGADEEDAVGDTGDAASDPSQPA